MHSNFSIRYMSFFSKEQQNHVKFQTSPSHISLVYFSLGGTQWNLIRSDKHKTLPQWQRGVFHGFNCECSLPASFHHYMHPIRSYNQVPGPP